MKKYFFSLVIISIFIIPIFTSAADYPAGFVGPLLPSDTVAGRAQSGGCQTPQDLAGLFTYSLCLLTYYVTPFLFGLAGVVFIVGVVKYVRAGDNEEKRGQGRDLMWFGIIALFVMITVWGFVNILSRSIFGKDSQLPNLPRQATSVFQQ